MKRPAPGVLRAAWARPERGEPHDLCYDWGDGCERRDARLLHHFIGSPRDGMDFIKELQERGYDLSTLRFTIRKLPAQGDSK